MIFEASREEEGLKRLLGVYEINGKGLLWAIGVHLHHELEFSFDIEHDSTYNLKEAIEKLDSGKYSACLITSYAISTIDIDPKDYSIQDIRYHPRKYAGLHLVEHAAKKGIPVFIETGTCAWRPGDLFHLTLKSKAMELGGYPYNSMDWTAEKDEARKKEAFENFLKGFKDVFPRKV